MKETTEDLTIQSIDIRVRDLKTSIDFYSRQLGFVEISRDKNVSLLSANGDYPYLIKLVEDKTAPVRLKGSTGLFHIAFLFPSRKELAKVFMRLFKNNTKFQGFSDHLVSEAIYLADPDGNGIELYADKPKETWVWKNGEVVMDSLPLDLSKITIELNDKETLTGIHPATMLGHIHLNVSDLRKAEEFYNEILKFKISNYSYPGAKFFAKGDYHHHIGTNTWLTNKKIPKNENSLGMISFMIKLSDKTQTEQIKQAAIDAGITISSEDATGFSLKDFDNNFITVTSD